MELVLNKCIGAFVLSDNAVAILGEDKRYNCSRQNSKLISLIKQYGSDFVSHPNCSELVIVEIPRGATNLVLDDYNGIETIFYRFNGKAYQI